MSLMGVGTKCACGAELRAKMRKPNPFADSFAKINCSECGSRFMLTTVRDMDEKGRVFRTHVDILELSGKAEKVLAGKLPVKAKIAAAKIANAIGIEPKTDNSVIETSLDEVNKK